jgi:hypothetical protein
MAPKSHKPPDRLARVLVYLGAVAISAVAILIVTMITAQPREMPCSSELGQGI